VHEIHYTFTPHTNSLLVLLQVSPTRKEVVLKLTLVTYAKLPLLKNRRNHILAKKNKLQLISYKTVFFCINHIYKKIKYKHMHITK